MNGPTRSKSSLCAVYSSSSSSLHWIPTGNMGMPEAISSLQYTPTVRGISGGRRHTVDMRKKLLWGFSQYHFILGWKENRPLLHIKLYSLARSYTLGMKELESIPLMTCFCRFNLEILVIHTIKILESDIWFIIFPIFHCSQKWGSEGKKVVQKEGFWQYQQCKC